ncbi:type ISP restriction/modification enzyme [Lignipirellula cremea]|uniref:site-specific DNA-methyltransferase (adenine-specific) n=1 Tax=Lignipirellula cremea TaxID=2528010 RepID=A0A518DYS8_9BACT|nr:type ISP restriction/modification enzyme [Lignipirellula cremea]QDU96984.1 N-6 DNA Methylase [Lignipirellula cremea]
MLAFLKQPERFLAAAQMAAIEAELADDFIDPRVRLFELFQAALDSDQRRSRGVFYTPAAVVRFLVDAVQQIDRCHFHGDGSSHRNPLTIVDPACGAGAFLFGVLDRLSWSAAFSYEDRPAPVLLGLEVDPVAACVAEYLLVERSSGLARRASLEAPQILTLNPLEGPTEDLATLLQLAPLAVIGNPPYANFGRRNRTPWIRERLADYKRGLVEKKHNLDDDFIKFICWGQCVIDRAGQGVLAFVTSNTYLDGLTHRRMRASLGESFDEIFLLDLHGGGPARERAPAGVVDENIFPIRQGVALGVFVKRGTNADDPPEECGEPVVWRSDLWGSRQEKLTTLARTPFDQIAWERIEPRAPAFAFSRPRSAASQAYEDWPALDHVFLQYVSGVQTKNDALWTSFHRDSLADQVRERVEQAGEQVDLERIRPFYTAPFDRRWIYYAPHLLGRARLSVMRHVLAGSWGLAFMRQATGEGEYDHFLAVGELISDRLFHSARGAPFLAPAMLHEPGETPTSNLSPDFLQEASDRQGRRRPLAPEALLDYLYAVFYSRWYRTTFAEQLPGGFPRVPLTSDSQLFTRTSAAGRKLRRLHLQGAPSTSNDVLPESDERLAVKVRTDAAGGCIWLNQETCVPASGAVQQYRIGGLPVLERWLKQRKKIGLRQADLQQCRAIIAMLEETVRLQKTINTLLANGV